MTREEAIRTLKEHKITFQHDFGWNTSALEAIEMAIKALEQEPCEDCISREEVCDYIAEFVNHEYATDREHEMVEHIIGGIQHFSSVQPKKVGHWIKNTLRSTWWYKCSECGCENWSTGMAENFNNYCPNCGAKMEDYEKT